MFKLSIILKLTAIRMSLLVLRLSYRYFNMLQHRFLRKPNLGFDKSNLFYGKYPEIVRQDLHLSRDNFK